VSGPYTVKATPIVLDAGVSQAAVLPGPAQNGRQLRQVDVSVTVICATVNCSLTGLKPGTIHEVFVIGKTTLTGAATIPSPKKIFTTLTISQSPIIAQATEPSTLSVTYSPSITDSGPYTVTATPIGGGSPTAATCGVPYDCSLTGLTPGTTYKVTATASTASGPTPASPPTTIAMPAARFVGLGLQNGQYVLAVPTFQYYMLRMPTAGRLLWT